MSSINRRPLQAHTPVPGPHKLPPHLSGGRRCRASPRSGRSTPLQACTHVQSPHKPPPHLRGDRRRREAAAGTCERPRREKERGGVGEVREVSEVSKSEVISGVDFEDLEDEFERLHREMIGEE